MGHVPPSVGHVPPSVCNAVWVSRSAVQIMAPRRKYAGDGPGGRELGSQCRAHVGTQGQRPASRSPGASGATYLMSLSVRPGQGLLRYAEVPQQATSGPKLPSTAHPQRIHTPPAGAGGADETSADWWLSAPPGSSGSSATGHRACGSCSTRRWYKSSYTNGQGGSCVEVADLLGAPRRPGQQEPVRGRAFREPGLVCWRAA